MIIRDNNIQKWLFDYFEGNLTPHEQIELRNFISQNPAYQSEFDAWEKSYPSKNTKSKKNRIPVYAGASSLLVETSIWARFNWKYAASIIMFIVGGSLIGYYNMPSGSVNDNLGVSTETVNDSYLSQKDDANNDSEEAILSNEKSDDTESLVSEYLPQENSESQIVSNGGRTSDAVNKINTSTTTNNRYSTNLNQGFSNVAESNRTIFTKEKGLNRGENETKQSNFALNGNKQDNLERIAESDGKRTKNEKQLSKLNPKSVVFFDNKIDKKVRFHSDREQKQQKRYFYAGFKDLAGRGIGVRSKKHKQDKELQRNLKASDKNIMITENGVGDMSKADDSDKNRKKKSHRNSDLALMNLYDPIFITTNAHPLNVNSSLAGALGVPRIKSSFRLQKTNSKDVLINSVNSFDMYINELHAGVGLVFSSQNLNNGAYNENKIEFTYAQKFEISRESSLTTSITYSGRQMKMDASKINYNSEIEVERGLVHNTYSDAASNVSYSSFRNDIGASTWYDGRYLYGGMQVNNLLRSKSPIYNETMVGNREPLNFSVQLGTDYRKSLYSDIVISPQINFDSRGGKSELWVGSSVKYRSLVAGLGVGTINSTSLKGLIGIQNHAIRIMYGFDYSNSALENGMFASHEISMRILLGVKRNNWSRFKK